MQSATTNPIEQILPGGGAMGALIREYDWSHTPLGPITKWPQSLRTAASVILGSEFPMYICWGPQFTELYNDAFRPILGAKHPVVGHSASDTWSEIWTDFVGPAFRKVRDAAEVTFLNDALVPINRFGFMEECYFSFCYSPVRDEEGAVGGVLITCIETPAHVISDRRMQTLRDLASEAGSARSRDEACERAAGVLATNPGDIPFALLYLLDADGRTAQLTCTAGIPGDHALAIPSINIAADSGTPFPVAEAALLGRMVVGDISDLHAMQLPGAPWPEHPRKCVALPIQRAGDNTQTAIVVLGLSPRRPLDDGYHSFLDLLALYLARVIGTGENSERVREAAEEERQLIATLQRVGEALTSNLELESIVQTVTDEATKLSGAQFGAFFYNLIDENGESYTLYSISGVPREEFSRFPMPRNTAVFNPTFKGEGVVRSDDIHKDPRYGHNAPYHGLPEGHLPVVSYLAVPVISRSGTVLGGLFFGHSQPAMFTVRHERLVTGIANWAAVSIDNASLYEAERHARQEADQARDDAQRASRAKSEFLAMMSHELRTPLNAIAGYVDLLRLDLRGPTTQEQQDDLSRIRRSQQHLASLIDDVLNMARIESGRLELRVTDVSLHALFADLNTFIAQQAADKKIAYVVADFDETLRVRADEDRLRQIMLNLLTNALKFTPAGGRVSIECAAEEASVEITVSDTGRGIPQQMADSIFEPFVQVEDRRTSPGERGIGLGLAISRDLARLMGGDVTVKSTEGEGSHFTVRLERSALTQS